MADDLVLEQLKHLRQDIKNLPTKDDLRGGLEGLRGEVRSALEGLRGEMLRHFVEVETRMTTEVHELIALLRDLVASRDRLAARVSQLERDVQDLKRGAG